MTTSTSILLPRHEVAQALGVSERTVIRLERDGQLPCVRIGSRVLYRRDVVEEFVERKTVAAAR